MEAKIKKSPKKAGVPHLTGDLYGKGGRYVFILRGERWKGYLIVAFLSFPVLGQLLISQLFIVSVRAVSFLRL